MEYTDFIVEVRNSSLARVGQLKQTDLNSLIFVPRDTAVGSWELKLPAYELNAAGVRVEHELCKALRQPGAGLIITGPGGVALSGPAVESSVSTDASDPDGIWSFTGVSDMHILMDALAWGDPTTYDLAAQTTANDVRVGATETLVYGYISRNIGPLAVTQRKNTRLTLATDQGRGVTQQKSPRFRNLLELVQEIVAGTSYIVDIVQVGANLEVRVTERADLSGKIRMDIANDQLSSVNYTYSAPGATHAIVAGQGEGTKRTMIMRSTADSEAASTAWVRRIERFIDQRQTSVLSELQGAGDDSLAGDGKTITAFEVTPNPNLNLVYGVDWTVGAKVTVVIQGQETTAIVSEVPISITSDGVLVGAVVGNPSGFTWEATVDAKNVDLDTRVSQLETNAEFSKITLLPVANGGTGVSSLTSGAYLKGAGTSAVTAQAGVPATDITGRLASTQLPSGAVIQAVTSSYTTQVSGANGWNNTGLTGSITPKFSTSRFIVLISLSSYSTRGAGSDTGFSARILRDGNQIWLDPSTYSTSYVYGGSSAVLIAKSFLQVNDYTGSSGTSTYSVQFYTYAGGTTYFQYAGTNSQMTILEVAP